MTLIPWRGDIFIQMGLKRPPDPQWWNVEQSSWEEYAEYLSALDPSDWKQHDLYRVLRLQHRRYFASIDDIQKSYRQIARRFHPDKMPGTDQVYPSVIKAAEILLNPTSRRAFDSVDPTFDDSVPDSKVTKQRLSNQREHIDRNRFFDIFRPVFERNSRWSEKQPVPHLGDWQTPDEYVDVFYRFWLDFSSWREYSFLDKEDKSLGQDRYERKMIDKSNRQERQKRRREELERIANLTELAKSLDPRLQLRKERHMKEKLARQEERKKERLLQERQAAEQARLKRNEELERQSQQSEQNSELHKLVVELTRQQSAFRQTALRVLNGKNEKEIDSFLKIPEAETKQGKIEALREANHRLSQLNKSLSEQSEHEIANAIGKLFLSARKESAAVELQWSVGELELLVKAVKIYPPGTNNRWTVVRRYLVDHGADERRTEKDIMEKARRLKCGERFQGAQFEPSKKQVVERSAAWTVEEQKRLEEGLKTFPASDENRWDKIAELVRNRTKAECMQRYKYIVEMLKKRNASGTQSK